MRKIKTAMFPQQFPTFKYYVLIAICIAVLSGFSQDEKLRNYNVKDGLPGSETYGVMQDSKGYIWVIGDMGVSRFTGYEFKNFSTNNGLPDNTLFGAWEDAKNRIWFRSFSGKLSYLLNDSIYSLPCNDTLEKLFRQTINVSIYVDKGDTIWLGLNRGFFIKINPGWTKKDVVKLPVKDGKYIFLIDKNGMIYGGNNPKKLSITAYDRTQKKLFEIDPDIANPGNEDMRFFLTRTKSGDFLGSINTTVFNFSPSKIINRLEEKHPIIYLLEDKSGSFVVCTYNGASVYEGKDHNSARSIRQLKGKVVTGTIVDNENELWFTTEGNGLFCLEHRDFKYYGQGNGLPESKISCMSTNEKYVITGHLDGSVCLFDKDSLKKMSVNTIWNSSVLQTRVNSIFNNASSTYITTVKGNYFLLGNQLKEMPLLSDNGIKKIAKSKDGGLWSLTYSRVKKFKGGNFEKVKDVLLENRIDNIFEDKEGVLWLCGKEKIYTYNGFQIKEVSSFSSSVNTRPIEVGQAPDKSLWVITRGGGVLIFKEKELIRITEKQGLAGNMCKTLFIDSNIVWVGTNAGLSKITIEKNGKYNIDNIYDRNGLLTNEVNSIIKYNNKLWVAHNAGISVFDPKNLKTNFYSMPVYILSVLINDSLTPAKNFPKLSYSQNNLTINYIGLSYKNAGHVGYKYKMSGLDSNWTYTTYTSVKFHTMPSGTYTFIVYATNNDGYWSKDPAVMSFTILPAWWQTIQFKIIVTLAWILVVLLTFKLRLSIIRKREKEKSELQGRIAQTELKALRAQMNPHFIYNAINSVQYFITNNDPESSQKYLAKFARLIRYVVDNSKPTSIPLQTEIDALILYLELEALRFEKKFEYRIEVSPDIDTYFIQIPSMLVQPYVENAIWHGLMHKEGAGKIDIKFTVESEVLRCIVQDDGIGRKRSQEIKESAGAVSKKSLGMSITKERLEIINQMNNTELSVVITDLADANDKPTGTKVELFIPFN